MMIKIMLKQFTWLNQALNYDFYYYINNNNNNK